MESLFLSFPLILFAGGSVWFIVIENIEFSFSSLYFLMCLILIFISNAILYFVLKKRYDFKTDVFLYGMGFISSLIVVFLLYTFDISDSSNILYMPVYYIIPLSLLFFSYAALFKNNDNKLPLCLMAIACAFFILGFIHDFEMFKQSVLFVLTLPILFGSYIGHYAIYRTMRPSLRNLAWASVLVLFNLIIIPGQVLSETGAAVIFLLISSTIISCFIGMICKYFKKNQIGAKTNE